MAQWKKIIVSGSDAELRSVTASSGILVGDNLITTNPATTTITGSFFGDGSGLTGIPAENITLQALTAGNGLAASNGNYVGNNATTFSVSTASAHFTDGVKAKLNTDQVISGSSVAALLPAGTVSGSSQISYPLISNIPSGIVSGAAQITPLLPTGTVSGSIQVIDILSSLNTYTGSNDTTNTTQNSRLTSLETASGSAIGRLNNLETFTSSINTTIKTQLDANTVVSGSSQITLSGDITGTANNTQIGTGVIVNDDVNASAGIVYTKLSFGGSGLVSGSSQVSYTGLSNIPAGIVSGAAQIVPLLPTGTVSGSSQIQLASITGTTFANSLFTFPNNLVIDGDLVVNGTTVTLNTTNLLIEDKFILLNSGSANPDEGGLVIDEGGGSGHAFIFEADAGVTRWGFNQSVSSTATTANTTAYAAAVVDLNNGNHADAAEYQKNGNIRIDTNGDIWIYS
jgi:hypothetical protein